MDGPLWRPAEARIAASSLSRFKARLEAELGAPLADYKALHAASIADPGRFWSLLWDYCGVIGSKGAPPFLSGTGMPGSRLPTAAS